MPRRRHSRRYSSETANSPQNKPRTPAQRTPAIPTNAASSSAVRRETNRNARDSAIASKNAAKPDNNDPPTVRVDETDAATIATSPTRLHSHRKPRPATSEHYPDRTNALLTIYSADFTVRHARRPQHCRAGQSGLLAILAEAKTRL